MRSLPGGRRRAPLGLLLLSLAAAPLAADGDPRAVIDPLQGAGDTTARYLLERSHVAVIELHGNYDQEVDGEVNALPRTLVAREHYAHHPDHYDFLVAFSTFEFDTGGSVAFHLGVQNRVQGIGLPLFDHSDEFGSDGRLQGYIDMAALSRYVTDPLDPGFERTLAVLAHEILHQWGAYVRFRRPDGTHSDALLAADGKHWSYLLDSDASVLYGNDWHDNGDGTFTSRAVETFFSPLDLYLAGFFGSEEVPPFLLLDNPSVDPAQLPRRGAEVTGTPVEVTIDDVIAAEGPRVPSAAAAQREFRAAFVLLARPGEQVTEAQIQALERIRRGLLDRFAALTGGRAILEVFPEALPAGEPGTPEGIPTPPPRDGASDLLEGLAWLRSRQTAEGFWEDRPGTRVRDTAAALHALATLDPQFTGEASAVSWISGRQGTTTDSLARAVSALASRGRDVSEPVAALLAVRNPDGGWGLGPGYASDPLDTALALSALAAAPGAPGAAVDAAVGFLAAVQGGDGGWGSLAGGPGRTGVTATVLRALEAAGRAAELAPAAVAFLAARQNPDGGFGDSPSTVDDTAKVLQALMRVGAVESVQAGGALEFLRTRQGVDGSWTGSVHATALSVDTLKRFGFPNWRFAAAPVADPSAPRDGERVRLTFTVTNDGNVEAPAGRLRLYEGEPGAGGLPVGADLDVPALGARQSAELGILWDSLERAGPRRLVAVLDPDGEVSELSELDNAATLELEVTPAPAEADLEVSEADLTVSPPRPDALPASLAVSATVRNLGQTDVPEATVQLLAGPPDAAVVVGETRVSVPQRSSSPVGFSYLLETPGTATFTVRVDPDAAVAEADETNNEASIQVTPAAAVDLAVASSDLAVEGEGLVGQDVTLRTTLRNLGTVDAPDAEVRFTVTDAVETREVLATTVRIPAGSTAERSTPWRVDLSGELTFGVEIDPEDLVAERDETNNAASTPFAAQGLDVPELTVDHAELTFRPEPGLEGAPMDLSVVVRNLGGQEVTEPEAAFYEGDPAQGSRLLGTVQGLPALAPGGSAVAAVTLPSLAGSGDRLIFAVVDPADRVAEFDETNNTAFRTLTVLALPDLAVSASALVSEPALPQAGETVTTIVTAANLGEQEAREVAVRLTVDGSPTGPDQILAGVAPDGTGTASFTWTFPAAGGTVTLAATADPGGAIPEGEEANNRAEATVSAFDPDVAVSHPFISPNGDGVKDSTVYSFTLAAPETVTVEVLDARGEPVRRHTDPGLSGILQGRFEWDGRDHAGRVVPDGDYRLRAVAADGRVLDEAPVVVDTDAWPLFAALGTPFQRFTNLTCSLVNPSDPQFPFSEEEAFFRVFSSLAGSGGIYRVPASGPPFERIVGISFPEYLVVSDDGEKMVYDPDLCCQRQGATANTDGSDRQLIPWLDNAGFRHGSHDLVYRQRDSGGFRLHRRPLDGSGPEETLFSSANGPLFRASELYGDAFSPDGDRMVFEVVDDGFRLVDFDTGAVTTLQIPPFDVFRGQGPAFATWSPDGSRFALLVLGRETDLGSADPILVYDRDGRLERVLEPPRISFRDVPDYRELGRPGLPTFQHIDVFSPYFSPDGSRLAFVTGYNEGAFDYSALWGSLLVADLATGGLTTVAYLEPSFFLFSFAVETWDGSRWVERGELHHSLHYSERELDLSPYLPDPDGELKVRVRQSGLEAAHVDRALLRLGRGRGPESERRPASAVLVPEGADVLDPLLAVDREVLDLHERQVELRWEPFEVGPEGVRLSLVAREEDLSDRESRPFRYPAGDGRSYHHRLGSAPALTVDGRQTGADHLGEPLFAEWSLPDTGHPGATVYGYAGSDGEHLYAALDFTVDNTEDGGRDWASLWIETPAGWRELRVTADDSTWGRVGFTRTGRVGYPHKYYEFRVPLAEVGASPGDTVALRFEAYGTAALLEGGPWLPQEGIPLWALDDDGTILYYEWFSGSTWLLDLEDAGAPRRVLEEFTTFHGAYFSPSGRKLVFRDGRDILDPQDACHNPSSSAEASYFTFESLANDFAALHGEATPDGRGVELSGTATDLHFARWRLEYADEAVPGFWTPIGEPVAVPAVDQELTTWVPPGAGAFLVRLTVEDRAGNRRSATRRFASASASPVSITDLHVASRHISPDGDGVQDAATLHYRILAPVHLEIGVFDQAGDRVRTLRRDHVVIGSEHDVVWDGRRDAGLPVPDGRYTIEVQGFSFPITVDTVPPEIPGVEPDGIAALVAPDGQAAGLLAGERSLELAPRVAWCASDAHPAPGGLLSIGEGAEPSLWRPFAAAGTAETCPPREEWPRTGMDLAQYVGHRFRLEARDRAGNSAAVVSALAPEELLVYRFRAHPEGAGGEMELETAGIPSDGRVVLPHGSRARLRVAETARSPLSRLFVRFQPGCGQPGSASSSGSWQEVEVTEVFEPGASFPAPGLPQTRLDLVWHPSPLDPGLPYCLELRGRTATGQDVLSNTLRLSFLSEGVVYRGLVESRHLSDSDGDGQPDPVSSALGLALGLAGLQPTETPVLWAHETVADPLADVVLVLTSEEDPRYAGGKTLKPAATSGGVMVFDGSDLLPCHTYRGVVVARVVAADGSAPRPLESNGLTSELPCLDVEARFREVPLPACGGPAEPLRRLVLTPESFDGVELTLLTLAVGEPGNVVHGVNRPASGQDYELELDTADLPEGSVPLFVRLTNGEGEEVVKRGAVTADRQPPAAQVTFPLDGQRLCATADEAGGRSVTVEGRVEEVGAGPAASEVQVLGSDGTWPRLSEGFTPRFPSRLGQPEPLAPHGEDEELRLEGFGGSLTVRWVAEDAGGHRVCSEPVSFFLDAAVEGLRMTADRDLISPNGDAVADQTLFSFATGEPVALDALVYRGVENARGGRIFVDPVGDPLRVLASGLASAGAGGLSWDGRTDGGAVVEDGLYSVLFRFTDGCGNQAEVPRGVTVDTTPPQVEILTPTTGDGLPLVVEVAGLATDLHFFDHQLDHGVGGDPVTWTTVERGNRPLPPSRAGLWNTFGLQGEQTLRLTARDRAGNASVHLVSVILPVRDAVTSDLQAVPDPLSPNGDGRRETASLRLGFAQEATASLAVTTPGGETVRTLAADETFPAGAALRAWDGRDAAGQPVADGEYRVRLEAAATSDPSRSQVETVPLTVDGTPPSLAVTRPREGFAPGSGAIVGTVADPLLVEFVVELADDPELPDWQEIGRGAAPVTDGALAILDGLAEGAYALRISARDAAENRSERVVRFQVDDTAPEVTLDAPAGGAVLGTAGGPVAVRGSVVEEHLHSWRLEVGSGADPSAWTEVAAREGAPPATLVSWDVTPLADGTYTLRLTAEDLAGLTAESRVTVAVDHTPPVVAIADPTAGSWVTGPRPITGTANDPHLALYRVEVAPAGTEGWSELGRSASPVASGLLLSWRALPPDGPYRLRVTAQDAAGNAAAAEVAVAVDTRPPAAPQRLAAALEGEDVELAWQANAEPDLAGYRIYRSGVLLTPEPLTATAYADAAAPEGDHAYTVTAVDRAGLESAPSAAAQVLVDRTPPSALIHAPAAGATVSGLVPVRITAASPDLRKYRLSVAAAGGAAQLLRSSPTPVRSEVVTEWSTAGLPEGSAWTLRLEAEDLSGNVGVALASVVVDNQAPAPPTGLAEAVTGDDVALTWDANAEADLAGYLLYRDGRLVHGSGDDLVRRALSGTSHTDADLPDGTFTYRLAAVDRAGNVSGLSAPATATLDLRAPHVEIVKPGPGTRFGAPLYVLAAGPDRDVVEVRFQMRPAGATDWSDLGVATAEPWETTWDPAGLELGDYELQAVARDAGDRTDPAPLPVPVTYTDLERPAATTGVAVRVDGGDARLSWTDNTEPDLAGYHVDRTAEGGSPVRVTSAPAPGTSFVDTGLPDDAYTYTVVAVDVFDNEAEPSAGRPALVYTPVLDRPFTPTRELATDLSGTARPGDQVTVEVSRPGGTEILPPVPAGADGSFAVPGAALERGLNELAVRAADGAGNRSKAATVAVISSGPPAPPAGLAADVSGTDVSLTWNPSPEPDVRGYRVAADGRGVPAETKVTGVTASASSQSSSFRSASRAVDGSRFSYWSPAPAETLEGEWLAVAWPSELLVREVALEWFGEGFHAVDYDLQVWDGGGWLTVFEIRGNGQSLRTHRLVGLYPTTAVRVVVHRIAGDPTERSSLRLAEIGVLHQPLLPDPLYTEAPGDGLHRYSATAVNRHGFESAPSESVEVPVGDAQGPEPVTLAASVDGPDVALTWTASPSPDLAFYLVFRDGSLLAAVFDLDGRTYRDEGPLNGTYRYTVVGVDQVGNHGPASNEAEATVALALPPAPLDLTVTDPGLGDVLDLAWTPGAGEPAAVAYRVLRSEASGGPYAAVGESTVPAFRDRADLVAGTTYFYVVAGLDGLGNAGERSHEASGTPLDRTGPPSVLHFPAPPGGTRRTSETIQGLLVGTTEPGAAVSLLRAGAAVAETTASAETVIERIAFDAFDVPRSSPDGRLLLLDGFFSHKLLELPGGSVETLVGVGETQAYWLPDGERLLVAPFDPDLGQYRLAAYRVADGAVEPLAPVDDVWVAVPSPDGETAVVQGSHGSLSGLLRVDLAAGEVSGLVDGSPGAFDSDSFAWSPDGSRLAYWSSTPSRHVEIVEPATGVVIGVPGRPATFGYPSWSPDGSALVYTASDAAGWWQIRRFRLADGADEPLTSGETDHALPRWSPDGSSVAYVADFERLERLDLATGEVDALHAFVDWWGYLEWVPGGRIVSIDDAQPLRVTPPGRFEARNVPLSPGPNRFTAVATDPQGNAGEPSAPMVVELVTADNADLAVAAADLAVLPGVPLGGQEVALNATVRNLGAAESPPSDLSLLLVPPSGAPVSVAERLDVSALAPGTAQSFTRSFILPATAGRFTLVATVDGLDRLLEADETNNRAELPFPVLAEAGPGLFVATDRPSYGTGEDVGIQVDLPNAGPTFTGEIEVAVEDSDGFLVEEVPPVPVAAVAPGEIGRFALAWNTGDTFAGDYRVAARLTGPDGLEAASAEAPFSILSDARITATVTTDRALYEAGETVRLVGSVRYESGNGPLTGAEARLRVLGAGDEVRAEWLEPLGELLPGAEATVAADWPSTDAAAGAYRARLDVLRGGVPSTGAESSFELAVPNRGILGTLALSDPAPPVGTPVVASFELTNATPDALSALPVEVALTRAAGGAVLAAESLALDLPPGATHAGEATFATDDLRLEEYLVVLRVTPPATAGTPEPVTLAAVRLAPVDATPPDIRSLEPADGAEVTSTSVEVRVVAFDALSGLDRVEARVDAGPWRRATLTAPADGLWSVTLEGLAEGLHQIEVRAVDRSGNDARRTSGVTVSASGEPELVATETATLAVDADGDGVPSPGDELLYQVDVTNSGGAEATDVVLTHSGPEPTEMVAGSVQTTLGTVVSEDPLEVSLGVLAAGEGATVMFRVRVDLPVPPGVDRVVAQGVVTSAELPAVLTDDPAAGGATDPTVTLIQAAPELVAEAVDALVADPDGDGVPSPGDTVGYTITVRNVGNTSATAVALAVPVPIHTALVAGSATAAQGTVTEGDPVLAELGEVPGQGTTSVAFRVVIDEPIAAGVREISAQGLLTSAELADTVTDDPEAAGPADPTVTSVSAAPVLRLEKTAVLFADRDGDGLASPGDELLYRVRAGNTGNTAATGLTLVDPIPEHTLLEPGTVQASGGSVELEDPVTVTSDLLPVGEELVVTFRTRIGEPFPLDVLAVANAAELSSAELAPVSSDDPATPEPADPTVTEVFITPEIAVDDVLLEEGEGAAVFRVSLSEPGNREASVDWRTVAGSAAAGLDFEPASGRATFAPGTTEAAIEVTVVDNGLDELDETLRLVLESPAGAVLADAEGTARILDDDPPPFVSVDDVTVSERSGAEAVFTLALSGPSGLTVTVDFSTADGSARAGADYVAASGTATIPAGLTAAQIRVPVLDDALDEPDETFSLTISGALNAVPADAEGVATVLDADPPPEVSIGDATVGEGDAGSTDLVFPASLSAPSGREVRATWSTTDGTAEAGSDYTPATGTLVFPEGAISASAAVQVTGDLLDELDETVGVELAEPVHALLAVASAEGTIVDDDEARISVGDVAVDEGDEGAGDALFRVDLATEADREITVRYATSAGTAAAEEDFTPVTGVLVFPPFETHRTIAVPVLGDLLLEPAEETFTVELSDPTETSIEDGLAVGTIRDDELCPGPNLLVNPGAEERLVDGELPGWVEVEGTDWTRRLAPPEPAEGEASFWAGTAELGELAQDADVAAYEVRVDGAGGQRFAFSGRVRTFDETPPDTARIVVEYRDRTNSLALETFDSGELVSPGEWLEVADERVAPAGTGWIRVRLIVVRFTEGDTDAYFDALALRSLRAPVLTVADAAGYEGHGEPVAATFAVRLSCPYHREVSAPYATADGTAVAGEDYVETSGVVTLPAGETEAPAPVPLLGDEVHEAHEIFFLELGTPAPADEVVALSPVGAAVITNDDFCPRSHGFWKTHGKLWPAERLTLGGVEYERPDLQAFLEAKGGDVTLHLVRELVATKLNLLVGSDPGILPMVETADDLLVAFPPGSDPRGEDRQTVGTVHGKLDDYNNSRCEETPVIPGDG